MTNKYEAHIRMLQKSTWFDLRTVAQFELVGITVHVVLVRLESSKTKSSPWLVWYVTTKKYEPHMGINTKKNVIWKGAIIKQITSKDISYTFDNPIWIGKIKILIFQHCRSIKTFWS